MVLSPTNAHHHTALARTPDPVPQHERTGTATGKRKGKRNVLPTPPASSEKRLRLSLDVVHPIESERDALNALASYRLLLACRAWKGNDAPTVHDFADLYGVERHWFSRRLREWWTRNGDLSRREGQGRKSTVTPKMIDVLIQWARGEKWMFTYAEAEVALRDNGWTEDKLKRFVHTCWQIEWASVKPSLTDEHKAARLEFALANHEDTCLAEVQADEKLWLTRGRKLEIKFPEECRGEAKYQHWPNKKKIPTIMVLMLTARPNPYFFFDGKIACIRVAVPYTAKRTSKNHKKGDVYLKDQTMGSEMFFELMRDQGFPAIAKAMWWMRGKVVLFRIDRARPHTGHDMQARLNELGKAFDPQIKVDYQPAKSPDTNVHDIGLFPSMSARSRPQQKHLGFFDVDALWKAVLDIWDQFDGATIERTWQDRTLNLREIIKHKGNNEFEVPHVSPAVRAALVPKYSEECHYLKHTPDV